MDIPDDPVIRCAERTGYPPWFLDDHGRLKGEEEDVPNDDEEDEEE